MEHNGKLYLTRNEDVLFDPSYRHRISPLEVSVGTKKGRPITILSHLDTFCQELQVNKQVFMEVVQKCIVKQLSVRCNVDSATGNIHVSGLFPATVLKDVVYGFIREFLLCHACGHPEVRVRPCESKKKVKHYCNACGTKTRLEPSDMCELVAKTIDKHVK